MNRIVVVAGSVAAIALAVLTADSEGSGWIAPPAGDHARLGRSEAQVLRGAAAAVPGDVSGYDPSDPFATDPGGTPAPDAPAAGGTTRPDPGEGAGMAAGATEPPSSTEPVATAAPTERTPVEIRDFEACVIDGGGDHWLGKRIMIYLSEEGEIWWIGHDKETGLEKRTEIAGFTVLKQNLDTQFGATLVVVPHQWTNWQEVQTAFQTAFQGAADHVFLGAVTAKAPNVLTTVPIKVGLPDAALPEDPFAIQVKEGEDGPEVTVNGEKCESFPADLAIKWNEWRKDHADADITNANTTNVILDVHRFTPMSQVAQIFVVLRDLGIEAERYTGAVWKRKRTR